MKLLTEKEVRDRLKHTKARTATAGDRCIIYYPGMYPLRKPLRGRRIIIAECGTWREAYDAVKGRPDLGRVKSATLKPKDPLFETNDCANAHRLVEYLRIYKDTEAEVLEHNDVYHVVAKQEPDLFSGLQ